MDIIALKTLPASVEIPQNQRQHGVYWQLAVSYCPSMDLIATFPQLRISDKAKTEAFHVDNEEDFYDETEDTYPTVDVFRLNGQKVFEIAIESDRKAIGILNVAWRSDGIILAVISSDCMIRLVNSFSGKIVHTFSALSDYALHTALPIGSSPGRQPRSPSSKRHSTSKSEPWKKRRCMPSSLSYTTHFLDAQSTQQSLTTAFQENGLVLEDLLGLNIDMNKLLQTKADLPRLLANIDVEPFLPKISTLPAGGLGDEEVFSNRTSIDTMFHPIKSQMKAGAVEILLAGHDDGVVHMRVFDSFEVGDIDLNRAGQMPPGLILTNVKQAVGHPLIRKVFVIAEEQDDGPTATHTRSHGDPTVEGKSLHVLSLDLRFIQQSSYNLPILATKSTQLNNLTRYLRQIEKQLTREVKAAFDLPVRFLRSINGDLAEGEGEACTFETVAYHAIVTGEVHPKMKEWLAEVVGDRGVKRWEKTVGDCLDTIRRLISECWNPAVERAAIIVSRLTGLVKANANKIVGVDDSLMGALKDSVDVMAVLGEDILREVGKEISNFSVFIKWLKWEVEAAGLEETSERLDEMRESSDHTDVMTVLKYISEGLHESKVKLVLLGDGTASAITDSQEVIGFYARIKEMREKQGDTIPSLTLATMLTRLNNQCEQLFEQIANTLRKAVLVQYVSKLPSKLDGATTVTRVVPVSQMSHGQELFPLHLCTLGKHRHKDGWVVCSYMPIDAEGSENIAEYQVESVTDVIDIKFGNDSEVLVLAHTAEERVVYLGNSMDCSEWLKLRSFKGEDDVLLQAGMKAGSLEVNGRKKRRAVAVADANGRGYGVFDLDSGIVDESGRDEDEQMTG